MTRPYKKELEQFAYMSSEIGRRNDYVQGGGGNTSYKLDGKLMAVKASGCRLDRITPERGYVILDYMTIAGYYNNIDVRSDPAREEESSRIIKESVVQPRGQEARPSVEAGLHSVLDKAVIHSHSVYANILCCSREGKNIVSEIFDEGPLIAAYIPYSDPGFALTVAIKKAVESTKADKGARPDMIFMENHGLAVTCGDAAGCLKIHTAANNMIRKYFNIIDGYPDIKLERYKNGYRSDTGYIKEFSKKHCLDRNYLESNTIYPDQIVYINNSGSISFGTDGIGYDAKESEARTIEETMLAYAYVIGTIEKYGLALRPMPQDGISFIKGWESEKYRKQIAENDGI